MVKTVIFMLCVFYNNMGGGQRIRANSGQIEYTYMYILSFYVVSKLSNKFDLSSLFSHSRGIHFTIKLLDAFNK